MRVRVLGLALGLSTLALPGRALAPPERVLQDRLAAAGLQAVELVGAGRPIARGRLPGEGELTVLLFGGCGPGAENGRRAALLAAADLARTPRRHTLEVVVCGDDQATGDAARRAAVDWLDLHPSEASRDAVLAALHLELDGRGRPQGAGLVLAGHGSEVRRLPPAWIAHAVLAGARAGGGNLAIGDRYWPLMGQLLGRYARSREASGAEPFLAAGVPALAIGGGGGGARWPTTVASIARRLDSLAGRPRDDDVFLALGGRIWSRRGLYWAGLAIWVALVAAGLPGGWRGAGGDARRRRGRRYLPGFALRMLFLVALLVEPVATLVLLAPAALSTQLPLRGAATVAVGRGLALIPTALFAGYWAVALAAGRVEPWPAQPARLILVMAGVGLATWLVGRRQAGDAV